MAFDRDDPAQVTALKDELLNDPLALGYDPDQGTEAVLLLLNAKQYASTKPIEALDIPDIAAIIDATEYDALSAYDKEFIKMFINRPAEELLVPYRDKLLSLFGPSSNTRPAIQALRDTQFSRAEVLFGYGSDITRADIRAVRNP